MTSSAALTSMNNSCFFESIREFPFVIDGKINVVHFLEASSDLVSIVVIIELLTERLGKVFAPVKYDMQGNIDKIKKYYVFDEASCLLELMQDEIIKGKLNGAESILWLNRAFLFFELTFQEMIKCLQSGNHDVNMANIFKVAYEGSVKKYHSWITQQAFVLICKMAPTLLQIIKSFEAEKDLKSFESRLENFNMTLHFIRCKIDVFFKDQNLFGM